MIKHDFIGHELEVIDATNADLIGIEGQVTNETKHTLKVKTTMGEKTLIKEQVVIRINDVEIDGSLINTSPEKRTKKKLTRWQRKQPKQ